MIRPQLTADDIAAIRSGYLDGATVRELAARHHRSMTTISKHTIDLRITPDPPVDIAPDDPHADHWQDRAACRGTDVDVFFPGEGDHAGREHAKRICAACPVVDPCLRYALKTASEGVWGGTSDRQRAKMRTRQAAA